MKRKRAKVSEIPLDNHRNKDGKGKWITDVRYRNSPAAQWQIKKLTALGCNSESLKGIRFHIANRLIHKMNRERRISGTAPQTKAGS